MNKIIPNGSWCLFEVDSGGSRNGKVVLVQHKDIHDSDCGEGYTIKYYHSEKVLEEDVWTHNAITLKPSSNDPKFTNINLKDEPDSELKVVGIFLKVLKE